MDNHNKFELDVLYEIELFVPQFISTVETRLIIKEWKVVLIY